MNLYKQFILSGTVLVLAAHGMPAAPAETNETPNFQEVYDLVRAHLTGAKESDLNRAAVQGLLGQLSHKVFLVAPGAEPETSADSPRLSQTNLMDEAYAYVRITQVATGLAEQVKTVLAQLSQANKLKGVVLDLRFAGGRDYAEAAGTADLFVATERPLLSWGEAMAKATTKTNALSMPIAVLVNRQTAGAAEALAAVLRQTEAALLLGGATAGQATVLKEFALRTGHRLRIATATVRLGNGQAMSLQGVKPDIWVEVSAEDEKAYFADPHKVLPKSLALLGEEAAAARVTGTNLPVRKRLSEADLVRMQKDGQDSEEYGPQVASRATDEAKPSVQDPVLARALDLLKGLAVVRQGR
jgi:hypothetical protein